MQETIEFKNELATFGEQKSAAYLRWNNYEILGTNLRLGRQELDILARKNNILVFVEVKTRSTDLWGPPELSVDAQKQKNMLTFAENYCRENNHTGNIRFDIFSVVKFSFGFKINWFPDAFFPGLQEIEETYSNL